VLEKENLDAVQQGISLENEKSKELYEVQDSAGSLEVLLAAQRLKSEELEKEMMQKKEILSEEMLTQNLEWEREQKEHDRETKKKEDQLKKLWRTWRTSINTS
jgi:hypothetical protein